MPPKKKSAPKKKRAAPKKPAARQKPAAPKKPAARQKPAAPKKRAAAAKPAMETRICSLCGTTAACVAGGIPSGWTITVDGRTGVEYMCDDCARRNIRAIEGKLPQEWWE